VAPEHFDLVTKTVAVHRAWVQ